jgi:hypothetical protein
LDPDHAGETRESQPIGLFPSEAQRLNRSPSLPDAASWRDRPGFVVEFEISIGVVALVSVMCNAPISVAECFS